MKQFIFTLFCFFSIHSTSLKGQICFLPYSSFPVGIQSLDIVSADFNNDGKADLAVANAGINLSNSSILILLGNGLGGFLPSDTMNANSGLNGLATGDFNTDGFLDIASISACSCVSQHSVSIFIGTGVGTFTFLNSYLLSNSFPQSIIACDLNMDSKLDLATTNGSNLTTVLYGSGTGTFGLATSFTVGSTPYGIVSSDFNKDGRPDLAITNLMSNNISILIGNGVGGFNPAANYSVGNYPLAISCGDFNLDLNVDLAVLNQSSNSISILSGNGLGTFSITSTLTTGVAYTELITEDLNVDGKIDIIAIDRSTSNVSIFENQGVGFSPKAQYPVAQFPSFVCSNDFNSDGYPDLAVVNPAPNSLDPNPKDVSLLLSCSANGIVQSSSNLQFEMYPNPSKGYFKLILDKQIENGEILIFNSLSQVVLSEKIFKGMNTVDTRSLSTGLYSYVILKSGVRSLSGKLIIE